MNDKELLELAAKAAGQERSAAGDLWSDARGQLWNPLTDDGDALRLAAKLRIDIEWQATQIGALPIVEAYRTNPDGGSYYACENESDYRLAIVLAAAEIGRSLP